MSHISKLVRDIDSPRRWCKKITNFPGCPRRFWNRPPTHSIRPAVASTASAVEFDIILHKILTERFIRTIIKEFWNRPTIFFEIEKSRFFHENFHWKLYENWNFWGRKLKFFISKIFDFLDQTFSTEISMKIFDENFRDFSISKIFVGRFQNSLIMVLINRFG